MKIINIDKFKKEFLTIDNPSRYVGGEYQFGKKKIENNDVLCAICFPDLYEIGMSNNAIRVIYDFLNEIEGVFCDRVFSIAPDAEKMFREKNIPLYTLSEHIKIKDLDYLGFSIGYELCATNILQVLELSDIPLNVEDRKDDDPIVFAGGPAATNPLPFSKFIDFVQIGEAENGSREIIDILRKFKTRKERIENLKKLDFLWYPGKKKTTRAVDSSFDNEKLLKHYVVPNMKVVQDNGVVEIMRGCPNGCRFCHAGQYYKPFRQRPLTSVYDIVKQNVEQFGYRKITLSSLSSGDYPHLDKIIDVLNRDFAPKQVSFSLPSLKVNTFALDILDKVSQVRKSGLTFAIETPMTQWQHSLNKEVNSEDVIAIIQQAKKRGWKLAKFYFMTGLPFTDIEKEEDAIVDYLKTIYQSTKINMNINIGTFIPKAHTPFQWVPQLDLEISSQHLKSIKHRLQQEIRGIKVSYHEPGVSYIEGIISRGDYDCGDLIQRAYENGCRLDAWEEHLDLDAWYKAIKELDYKPNNKGFSLDEVLPWDSISLNVSKQYLKNEYKNAESSILTEPCSDNCNHKCGSCNNLFSTVSQKDQEIKLPEPTIDSTYSLQPIWAIFDYSKTGVGIFCSHINTMRNFEMSFQRADIKIRFTEGFNPKPRMEFLNPLSLGVAGFHELMLCQIYLKDKDSKENLRDKLNNNLPEGFEINKIIYPPFNKKTSLSSIMNGSSYEVSNIKDEEILNKLQQSDFANFDSKNQKWIVNTVGETNFFKKIFGAEMNKFDIAGNADIVRTKVHLKGIEL